MLNDHCKTTITRLLYSLQKIAVFVLTSPVGGVAKYCNERICVCVCPFASISPEPHVRSLPNVLCKLPIAVARSSSSGVTKSQREGAFSVFSSSLTMHCTFGTHTKTAETIEMPFGLMTQVGPRCHVLDGGPILQGEGAILGGFLGYSKVLAIFAARFTVMFAAKGIIQSPITSCCRRHHSVCQANANNIRKISGCRRCGLSAVKWWWDCTARAVWYRRLRC